NRESSTQAHRRANCHFLDGSPPTGNSTLIPGQSELTVVWGSASSRSASLRKTHEALVEAATDRRSRDPLPRSQSSAAIQALCSAPPIQGCDFRYRAERVRQICEMW